MRGSPLSNREAEALAKSIVAGGRVAFSSHAIEEMAKDDLSALDAVNVIRAGYCERADFERGTWRYRMRTQRIVVPIAFRSTTELVVVTAWRVTR